MDEVGERVVQPAEALEGVVTVSDGGVVRPGGLVVLWWFVREQVDELLGDKGDLCPFVLEIMSVRAGHEVRGEFLLRAQAQDGQNLGSGAREETRGWGRTRSRSC